MKMYAPSKPAHAKSCCGSDDFDDARRSAAALGIPHYVLDFEEAFRRTVIERFANDYASRPHAQPVRLRATTSSSSERSRSTPTDWARATSRPVITRGSSSATTGRISSAAACKRSGLRAGAARRPSSSQRLLLPLGELDKAATRAHAGGWASGARQDRVAGHLLRRRRRLPRRPRAAAPGDAAARRGPSRRAASSSARTPASPTTRSASARGLPASSDGPRYVTRIDPATNTIVVGREDELGAYELVADEVNLIRPERFARRRGAGARDDPLPRKRRHRAVASIAPTPAQLRFDAPQRASRRANSSRCSTRRRRSARRRDDRPPALILTASRCHPDCILCHPELCRRMTHDTGKAQADIL